MFGPFVGGISIALIQVLLFRLLLACKLIKQEQMPDGPTIVIRSFIILIVVFGIVYFTGLLNGVIEPVDPTKPPETFVGS